MEKYLITQLLLVKVIETSNNTHQVFTSAIRFVNASCKQEAIEKFKELTKEIEAIERYPILAQNIKFIETID